MCLVLPCVRSRWTTKGRSTGGLGKAVRGDSDWTSAVNASVDVRMDWGCAMAMMMIQTTPRLGMEAEAATERRFA